MSALIRKAFASDLNALIELSRRTIDASYRPFLGDAPVDSFLGSGAADRYVEEHIDGCSVILLDGKAIGYAVCQDNVIDLMMIDRGVQRRGLGTMLLRHVEAMLFQRYDTLVLESFEKNEHANAFYRKSGWREVGRRFDATSGVDKILFRKSVERAMG